MMNTGNALLASAALLTTTAVVDVEYAEAGDVNVSIEPGPGAEFAEQAGLSLVELEQEVAAAIEDIFNVLRPRSYLRALADAHVFSTRGLGADYASNPKLLSVGVSANTTVGFGDEGFDEPASDQPIVGMAVNLAIVAGLNMGVIDPKNLRPLTVYANFFSRGIELEEFSGSLHTVGLHGQYKILRPKSRTRHLIVQWGGIDVTGGVEYSFMKLSLDHDLPSDIPVGGATEEEGGPRVVFNANGRFDIKSRALSLPLEVSSNLRILYFVTLFGGAGIDMQVGKNEMNVWLDGTLTGEHPDSGESVDLGTAHVDVAEDNGPSKGKLRFFGGAQLNAWRAKAFFQFNVAPDRAVGVTFGGRVAW